MNFTKAFLSVVLVAMLIVSASAAPDLKTPAPTVVAPHSATVVPVQRGRERHPAIRAAISSLERAKDDMQHADHDFGGHRVAALKACDQAIEQLRLALQYDRR